MSREAELEAEVIKLKDVLRSFVMSAQIALGEYEDE